MIVIFLCIDRIAVIYHEDLILKEFDNLKWVYKQLINHEPNSKECLPATDTIHQDWLNKISTFGISSINYDETLN
jgi:hypothetical protein